MIDKQAAEEYGEHLKNIFSGAVGLANFGVERLGIHEALGLSEQEWFARRIAGPAKLSIVERRQIVAAHPEMSTRELGAALGVDHATVVNDRKSMAGEDSPLPTPKASGAHVANNSGDNEWYTPAEYVTTSGARTALIHL